MTREYYQEDHLSGCRGMWNACLLVALAIIVGAIIVAWRMHS